MSDSSSSSDEETTRRLKSAVWDVKQQHTFFSNDCKLAGKNGSQLQAKGKTQPSLRYSKSEPEFSEDYGAVKASPELKSFVAKKLTSFLDGVIKENEYQSNGQKPQDAAATDDFRLFSTSTPGEPSRPAQSLKQPRKRIVESSSDSDSDEERRRLASVAVSLEDVIHSQSILSAVEETKPGQVITNNPLSLQVSQNSREAKEVGSGEKMEGLGKKKKKKKRKDVDQNGRESNEMQSRPAEERIADKNSHKHSIVEERTEYEDSSKVVSLQNDLDTNSQRNKDISRKKKMKSKKKSLELLVSSNGNDNTVDDANGEDKELAYVKKCKKKKKSKESVFLEMFTFPNKMSLQGAVAIILHFQQTCGIRFKDKLTPHGFLLVRIKWYSWLYSEELGRARKIKVAMNIAEVPAFLPV